MSKPCKCQAQTAKEYYSRTWCCDSCKEIAKGYSRQQLAIVRRHIDKHYQYLADIEGIDVP